MENKQKEKGIGGGGGGNQGDWMEGGVHVLSIGEDATAESVLACAIFKARMEVDPSFLNSATLRKTSKLKKMTSKKPLKKCKFIGHEAINWMRQSLGVVSRGVGIGLGQRLLACNLIFSSMQPSQFLDDQTVYYFLEEDMKYRSNALDWQSQLQVSLTTLMQEISNNNNSANTQNNNMDSGNRTTKRGMSNTATSPRGESFSPMHPVGSSSASAVLTRKGAGGGGGASGKVFSSIASSSPTSSLPSSPTSFSPSSANNSLEELTSPRSKHKGSNSGINQLRAKFYALQFSAKESMRKQMAKGSSKDSIINKRKEWETNSGGVGGSGIGGATGVGTGGTGTGGGEEKSKRDKVRESMQVTVNPFLQDRALRELVNNDYTSGDESILINANKDYEDGVAFGLATLESVPAAVQAAWSHSRNKSGRRQGGSYIIAENANPNSSSTSAISPSVPSSPPSSSATSASSSSTPSTSSSNSFTSVSSSSTSSTSPSPSTTASSTMPTPSQQEQDKQLQQQQSTRTYSMTTVVPVFASTSTGSTILTKQKKKEQLWTWEEEDSDDIRYFACTHTGAIPKIRAATPDRLVEWLTSVKYFDTKFREAFLLTYRSFMTPRDLLEKLYERFFMQPPTCDATAEEMEEFAQMISTLRLKVLTVIKYWIKFHFKDFLEEESLSEEMHYFLQQVAPRCVAQSSAASLLDAEFRKMEEKHHKMSLNQKKKEQEAPTPNKVVSNQLLSRSHRLIILTESETKGEGKRIGYSEELSIKELAEQMTLLEHSTYSSIRPSECLNKAWSSEKKKHELAPNVMRMISRFNMTSQWVTSEIVGKVKLSDRVAAIKRFLQLGKCFADLRNYNGVIEVMSGINSSPVRRLKSALEEAKKDEQTNAAFEMLDAISDHSERYKNMRGLLRSSSTPAIPYIGIYLTDLTFIEDGNPNEVDGLVNWNKRQMLASVISEALLYQSQPYPIQEKEEVQEWLQHLPSVSEEEAYDLSLRVEPRDTSEAFEKMLMEEDKLRAEIHRLQLRIDHLESNNKKLKKKNSKLTHELKNQQRLSSEAAVILRKNAMKKKLKKQQQQQPNQQQQEVSSPSSSSTPSSRHATGTSSPSSAPPIATVPPPKAYSMYSVSPPSFSNSSEAISSCSLPSDTITTRSVSQGFTSPSSNGSLQHQATFSPPLSPSTQTNTISSSSTNTSNEASSSGRLRPPRPTKPLPPPPQTP